MFKDMLVQFVLLCIMYYHSTATMPSMDVTNGESPVMNNSASKSVTIQKRASSSGIGHKVVHMHARVMVYTYLIVGEVVAGCRPVIVDSTIEPFSGWRGNVAFTVDHGGCPPTHREYL